MSTMSFMSKCVNGLFPLASLHRQWCQHLHMENRWYGRGWGKYSCQSIYSDLELTCNRSSRVSEKRKCRTCVNVMNQSVAADTVLAAEHQRIYTENVPCMCFILANCHANTMAKSIAIMLIIGIKTMSTFFSQDKTIFRYISQTLVLQRNNKNIFEILTDATKPTDKHPIKFPQGSVAFLIKAWWCIFASILLHDFYG